MAIMEKNKVYLMPVYTPKKRYTLSHSKMLKLKTALQYNIFKTMAVRNTQKLKQIYKKILTYKSYLHAHMMSGLHNHNLTCKEQWYEFRAE